MRGLLPALVSACMVLPTPRRVLAEEATPPSFGGRVLGTWSGFTGWTNSARSQAASSGVFRQNQDLTVMDLQRIFRGREGPIYLLDDSMRDGGLARTTDVLGVGDRFTWIRCQAPTPPGDRWNSIEGSFEFPRESEQR